MTPNNELITIHDNVPLIERMLMEMVFTPRLKALEFSRITKQTPNLKIGYPGQHLASLITGMQGARTGARGHDIIDGSEVKSCSRVDQVDECRSCKAKVARSETICPNPECQSTNIERRDDSKWLFTIKSEEDLRVLTVDVPRVLLIITDYPQFAVNNFDIIRIEVFEIWTGSDRNKRFVEYMKHYYEHIYLGQKKIDDKKTPAPKNLFPYAYPFYMCNPTKVFSCLVHDVNVNPRIETVTYVEPHVDRGSIPSESLPSILLERKEIQAFIAAAKIDDIQHLLKDISPNDFIQLVAEGRMNYDTFIRHVPVVDEKSKLFLPNREVGAIRVVKEKYKR